MRTNWIQFSCWKLFMNEVSDMPTDANAKAMSIADGISSSDHQVDEMPSAVTTHRKPAPQPRCGAG